MRVSAGAQTRSGVRHAEIGVDADSRKLRGRFRRRVGQWMRAWPFLFVLDFLLSLPEEQIRADRRTHDGDDCNQVIRFDGERRPQYGPADLSPRHFDDKCADHVTE